MSYSELPARAAKKFDTTLKILNLERKMPESYWQEDKIWP